MASRNVDEYLVSVPKHVPKKYNVMRFNAGDKVDIRKWVSGSLVRDMSGKKIYEEEEVYPEFGEGSEYGRKQREEARRLKYGIRKSKFQEKNQPWNLTIATIDTESDMKKKMNGKSDVKPKVISKEFSGKKEGGIGEGSVYFIFTQRPDCTFEAHPVEDWFNFKRKIRHRTLTDEEAEAAWDKRDKIVNHLNYMARKRLHINEGDEEGTEDGAVKSENKKNVKKDKGRLDSSLTIHDNEDYDLYMSDSSSGEDEEQDKDGSKKKKKKNKKTKDDESEEEKEEAIEDSDDGEHEGTEIAYASDVSSENEEVNDSKIAPRGLDELTSSSSSEDEEENKEKSDEKNPEKQKSNKKPKGSDDSASSGNSDSDMEDEDSLSHSALFMQRKKTPPKDRRTGKQSSSSSRSSTPTSELAGSSNVRSKLQDVSKKLEAHSSRQSPLTVGNSVLGKRGASTGSNESSVKRQKFNRGSGTSTPTKDSSQQGITEEAVRRYLTHKPITTKDLLKKFKTKKTGLGSKELVDKVANILKKLNPQKKNINDKMHLYLKAS